MKNKTKKIISIFSFLIILAPFSGFAQTSAPTLPNLSDTTAPISNFIDSLKGVLSNGLGGVKGSINTPANGGSGVSLDTSSIQSTWDSINNWFSENVGISFRDIVKFAANVLIWFWELLIKLIQAGVSKL